MGNLELTRRLRCPEAQIDSTKVRDGRLQDAEWDRIALGVSRLAEARLYLDDNPNVSVMEIRAKARRLKSQLGDLGLRSEEHTSELQSLMRNSYAVFCLKKKNKKNNNEIDKRDQETIINK